MRILYDYDWLKQEVGGVSRCTIELIKKLPEDISVEIPVKACRNLYLRDFYSDGIMTNYITCDNFITSKNFIGKKRLFKWLNNCRLLPTFQNINRKYAIECLKKQDFDIFHCPSNDCVPYFLDYLNNKPFVLTVHDMISEIYRSKNTEKQSYVKKELVKRADKIIVVSNKTKEDLIDIWGVNENKISVIYHGKPEIVKNIPNRLFNAPYILYVGRRHTYKNFLRLMKEFAFFHKIHPEVLLVTTGGVLNKEESYMASKMHISESIKTVFATDDELASLYKNAICFIFPSLYEGFGLPILEAYSYDCPVLLNNTSCFPEIAGNAAVYFHDNGEGDSDILEKLLYIYELSEVQKERLLIEQRQRLALYSWKKSAQKLASVYKSL